MTDTRARVALVLCGRSQRMVQPTGSASRPPSRKASCHWRLDNGRCLKHRLSGFPRLPTDLFDQRGATHVGRDAIKRHGHACALHLGVDKRFHHLLNPFRLVVYDMRSPKQPRALPLRYCDDFPVPRTAMTTYRVPTETPAVPSGHPVRRRMTGDFAAENGHSAGQEL